jgi:hypothetical protein
MRTLVRIGLATVLLGVLVQEASAQSTVFIRRTVNLDYYLTNYYNRVAAWPRGSQPLDYPAMALFSPTFNFQSHDWNFEGMNRTSRTAAMGGAGVAFISGAGSLNVNPAGLANLPQGAVADLFFNGRAAFGSSSASLQDAMVFNTGVVGSIVPLDVSVDPRTQTDHGGLFLAGRPFDRDRDGADPADRITLALGYRRFVDISDGTNSLTTWLPDGGVEGLDGTLRSASQSRETGGIDAGVAGIAVGFGDEESPFSLNVGASAQLVSGRVRADQIFTVSQLSRTVVEYPGQIAPESFIEQKYTTTVFDVGGQVGLLGDVLRVGGMYRPGYTMEMRNGKYGVVENGFAFGSAQAIVYTDGELIDYDLDMPAYLRAGGAFRLGSLVGQGEERRGALGLLHRFFGRGVLAVDYSSTKLSESEVMHLDATLQNPSLVDEIELLNLGFEAAFPGVPGGPPQLDTSIRVANGDAGLMDQEAIHIGFETMVMRRPGFDVAFRLGWEEIPLSFPSLALGPAQRDELGREERPVLFNADGTPKLEESTGDAITLGFGVRSGNATFSISLRAASYEYVGWNGAKQPLTSYYDPESGDYLLGGNEDLSAVGLYLDPSFYAAQSVKVTETGVEVSASLAF